jgi:hypothetical protein
MTREGRVMRRRLAPGHAKLSWKFSFALGDTSSIALGQVRPNTHGQY